MKKKLRQTSGKDGRRALSSRRRAKRSPCFTLTPEQVVQHCEKSGRAPICAGQVLAVMDLMVKEGWTLTDLAVQSGVSRSHLSEFLRLKKFFTTHFVYLIARAFGLKVSVLDALAEDKMAA